MAEVPRLRVSWRVKVGSVTAAIFAMAVLVAIGFRSESAVEPQLRVDRAVAAAPPKSPIAPPDGLAAKENRPAPAAVSRPSDDAQNLAALREKFLRSQNLAALIQEALTSNSVEAGFFATRAIGYCLQLQAALGFDLSRPRTDNGSLESTSISGNDVHQRLQARSGAEAKRCIELLQIYPDLNLLLNSLRDGRMRSGTSFPRELFASTYAGTGVPAQDLALLRSAIETGDPFTIDRALSGLLATAERSQGELILGEVAIRSDDLGVARLAADVLLCQSGGQCLPRDLRVCQMTPEYCGMPILEVMRRTSAQDDWAEFWAVYAALQEATLDRPNSGRISWRPK